MKATAQMGGLTRPEGFNYLPAEWSAYIAGLESVRSEERLCALIEQLAERFKGYLPWPDNLRDSVVRGHEMFIEDTIKKMDAIRALSPARVAEEKVGEMHWWCKPDDYFYESPKKQIALEKDAARYRWLRVPPNHYFPEEQGIHGELLDAAIDEKLDDVHDNELRK